MLKNIFLKTLKKEENSIRNEERIYSVENQKLTYRVREYIFEIK